MDIVFVFGESTLRSKTVGRAAGAILVSGRQPLANQENLHHRSWNPELSSPPRPSGIKAQEGYYLVGINGKELMASDDPYRLLDGTLDRQTVLTSQRYPILQEPERTCKAHRQRKCPAAAGPGSKITADCGQASNGRRPMCGVSKRGALDLCVQSLLLCPTGQGRCGDRRAFQGGGAPSTIHGRLRPVPCGPL